MIHTFQLAKTVNEKEHEKIRTSLKGLTYTKNNVAVFYGLYEKGIMIYFKRKPFTKKDSPEFIVEYVINPSRLVGNDSFIALYTPDENEDISGLIDTQLFNASCHLPRVRSCEMTRCDFTFDVRVGDENSAKEYIKLINRAYIPYGFERYMVYSKNGKRYIPSKNDFNIYIKNKINIVIYNKKEAMKDYNKRALKRFRYDDKTIDSADGIIRFEIRCMGSFMKRLINESKASNINEFLAASEDIGKKLFLYYYEKIFGSLQFLFLQEAIDEINSSKFSKYTKLDMIDFLKTANRKRSINKALDELGYTSGKDKEVLLDKFRKLNLSFVTIPCRSKNTLDYPVLSPLGYYVFYGDGQPFAFKGSSTEAMQIQIKQNKNL